MKKILVSIVGILLLISLVLTAPSKRDFVEHVSSRFQTAIRDDSLFADESSKAIAKGVLSLVLSLTVDEKDYYIFKIFTLNMQFARAFGADIEDIKVVGIASHFIPLGKGAINEILNVKNNNTNEKLSTTGVTAENNFPDIRIPLSKESNLHDKTEVFVEEIYNGISSNNEVALRVIDNYWSDDVLFQGIKIEKQELINRKTAFFEKWPLRNYIANKNTLEIECEVNGSTCQVNGLVGWAFQTEAGTRRARGNSEFTFVIDYSTEIPKIIEESEKILRK